MYRMLAGLLLGLSASATADTPAQIAAGSQVLWLQNDGTVWASGDADAVRGDAEARARKHFLRIAGLERIVSIAINHDSSDSAAAIDADGALWLWGELAELACTREECGMPAQVPRRYQAMGSVRAVALGRSHLIAIGRDGKLRSAGDNALGQLGSGPLRNESRMQARLPRLVEGMDEVVAVAAQGDTSLVLRGDGSVWGMGSSRWGLLGESGRWKSLDFTDPPQAQPVRVGGLDGIKAISLGRFHGLALDRDGKVWGWGVNESAQLATPAVDLVARPPAALHGLQPAAAIAAGDDYTLVLKRDGSVWARGGNVYGTLGDGGDELEGDLRRVTALDDRAVSALFAGDYNAFARLADGRMLGWGTNGASVGGFAAGSDETTLLPVQLDREALPPQPSAAVRAGAAAFLFATELGDDQVSERSELWLDGEKAAVLDLDRSTPRSHRGQAALELAPGVHAYELRGETQMLSGQVRRLGGRGAVIVTREGIEAQFRADVAARGLLPSYRESVAAVRAAVALDRRVEVRSLAPPPLSEIDAYEKQLGRRLPRTYRAALQRFGPFALGPAGERYPAVALYAPAQFATLDAWVAQALQQAPMLEQRSDLTTRDHDMLDRFRIFSSEIAPARQRLARAWKQDRVGALFPEQIWLAVPEHPTPCGDGRARQRLVDFFDVQQDESSGEERYFAWADTADCELDLIAAIEQAVFEHYTAALRANGIVFVRAAQDSAEPVAVTPERVDGDDDGELRLRLSGGEAVTEY